jgi:4,5-dihydroxyphthalate decarboxylase
VTTGLWARSILQHQYGVDLSRITWLLSGDEHVAEYRPPANVVPIESGKNMEEMLIAGDIPAAIGVQVDSPVVKPLIAHARDAGFAALRERGLYPINHTIVIRNDVLAAHPGVARDLFDAFDETKRGYVARLAAGHVGDADDQFFKGVMDAIGDPLPYGIEANRSMIDAVVGHAVEQGIIPRRVDVEELFAV